MYFPLYLLLLLLLLFPFYLFSHFFLDCKLSVFDKFSVYYLYIYFYFYFSLFFYLDLDFILNDNLFDLVLINFYLFFSDNCFELFLFTVVFDVFDFVNDFYFNCLEDIFFLLLIFLWIIFML